MLTVYEHAVVHLHRDFLYVIGLAMCPPGFLIPSLDMRRKLRLFRTHLSSLRPSENRCNISLFVIGWLDYFAEVITVNFSVIPDL